MRALQEGEVLPIGGIEPIVVDVRVVAATHRNLATMVEQQHFRADLLARLTGFTITLPPLRERRDDLGALVHALVARHSLDHTTSAELAPAAIRALHTYPWPLNIRELEKAMATAIILSAGRVVEPEHLPKALHLDSPARSGSAFEPIGRVGQKSSKTCSLPPTGGVQGNRSDR